MGFLDNLRNRLRPQEDDYDDYYDDYDDRQESRSSRRRDERETSGVLGNTRRPEAESVSVYTRSGRPVAQQQGENPNARAYTARTRDYEDDYRSSAPTGRNNRGYATREREYATRERDERGYGYQDYSQDETSSIATRGESVLGNTTGGHTPGDIGLKPIPRQSSSGKLPPYVIKPASYDDVQMVVRRVRTGQPVVLAFRNTNIETAKRVLDFCFGLSCGVNGTVDELGDRVFVVLPEGIELSQQDIDKLVQDGTIER